MTADLDRMAGPFQRAMTQAQEVFALSPDATAKVTMELAAL